MVIVVKWRFCLRQDDRVMVIVVKWRSCLRQDDGEGGRMTE